MNLGSAYISKIKLLLGLLLIVFLLGSLGVILYMFQTKTFIFKSKASNTFINAFEIKDAQGNLLTCDGSTNPPTCTTSSLDISIRVKDLNALTQ